MSANVHCGGLKSIMALFNSTIRGHTEHAGTEL